MAAETDKAALCEGQDEVTVEMIAAAWSVVRARYPNGRVLGPGPGFREAIEAALALRPLCDLEVQIVEAETNAEVDREFAETSRKQADAASARADRLAAEMEALRTSDLQVRTGAAELAGLLCYVSAYDDPKALRDHCWKAGAFLEKHVVARAADKPGERTGADPAAQEGQPDGLR